MKTSRIKTNIVLIIILLVTIGGYVFFFLSPHIFEESTDKLINTPINTEIKLDNQHSMILEDWQYCEEDRMMEVILSFDNRSGSASERYLFHGVSRNRAKDKKAVECEVAYQSAMFSVILIRDVPKDFNEFALSVGLVNKHLSDDEITSGVGSIANVFTNKHTVSRTDKIEGVRVIELYVKKIEKTNEELQTKVKELVEANNKLQTEQNDILERVTELKSSEIYLTEQETENLRTTIRNYQSKYDSNQKIIEENEDKIYDYEYDISDNKEKIAEIKKLMGEGKN